MEKSDQKEVEYMMNNELWIDTRLTDEEMDFLNDAMINNSENISHNWDLAGNISKSELIEDKDNWFYETALKKHTEKMFYDDWNNYRKYHIEKEEPLPEFGMKRFWVNYQKQHEFNPIHGHGGLFSFVVFVKIPTHWKEQHALSISANSNTPVASDFEFVWSKKNNESCETTNFPLSPEDEGRMLFFPAWLKHQVFPFYECEEERVTISGNIVLDVPNRSKELEISVDGYEGKENTLKMLENTVRIMKKELEQMKKEREKEE